MSTMNICVLVYVCVSLLANAGLVLETMRRPFVRKASWTFYWAAIVAGGFVWSRCWMAYFTYDHPPEPGERDSVIAFWLIQYATCSVNTIFVLYHMWVLGKEERMLKPRTLRIRLCCCLRAVGICHSRDSSNAVR